MAPRQGSAPGPRGSAPRTPGVLRVVACSEFKPQPRTGRMPFHCIVVAKNHAKNVKDKHEMCFENWRKRLYKNA